VTRKNADEKWTVPPGKTYGDTVRRAGAATPGPAAATAAAPAGVVLVDELPEAAPAPAPGQPLVYESAEERDGGRRVVGKPRTTPRPMPEYPRHGYKAYRLIGDLPDESGRWLRFVDWALGHPGWLLYIGITCRASFIRRVEHSDTKDWAGDVRDTEEIRGEHWDTLYDTVIDDQTGRPWLVFDVAATADDGIRPIKPGEAIDTEPAFRLVHGEMCEVYSLDDVAGVVPAGRIQEGARTGEKRLIQAWDGGPRPIHNVEHNEGDHAVNRVARRFPRLVALARRQALAMALVWLMLAVAVAQVPGVTGLVGFVAASVLMQAAQVVRLAFTGVGRGRRRPRKPRGSKAWQRRRSRR
jgi:hypothetical protein